jgi:hypothetical protein
MRPAVFAALAALCLPAAALAASDPKPSREVPPPPPACAPAFPALDAASKDPAKMSIKISPERQRGGRKPQTSGTGKGKTQACARRADEAPKETRR